MMPEIFGWMSDNPILTVFLAFIITEFLVRLVKEMRRPNGPRKLIM